MFYALIRFGFSPNFISWIQLLYSSPLALVNVNGIRSNPFPLSQGNRQGCPLSPSLFALTVEPLAIWLRSEEQFKSITSRGLTHKLSLYADDLLLYISDPSNSQILQIFKFQKLLKNFSGYKLNLQKNKYFPVNDLANALPQNIFPFERVSERFKYLGIFVSKSFAELAAKNFDPLLEHCTEDLARWSSRPLSLMGHANLTKIVKLPRFLYPFQQIPIFIPKSFFFTIDKLINSFLWCGKRARIGKEVLQLSKAEGGLALPHFRQYYWACNINKLLFQNSKFVQGELPQWAQMEIYSTNLSLWSVVCSQLPLLLKDG